jgi:hypothetical protein
VLFVPFVVKNHIWVLREGADSSVPSIGLE